MMSTQQKTDVNVIAVENNSWSNAALDDEGRVWTWGNSNSTYRFGRATSAASNRVNPFNRGGQVTATIYADENLPFILQISGSVENTLALDRFGNVWSWGYALSGALGRTGNRGLPGKVELPDGVKAKWIAAAYHGGKIIDTAGNIWVWGEGSQYGLGTGSITDVDSPVKLTLDASGQPLPSDFVMISSSDFNGNAAAMAVTSDGKIFTWGNGNTASCAGASRPKQTGSHSDIKKICVGNGTFGFLTNSGEAWTWGDNRTGVANGRLGHGNTLDLTAPKRIENVINSGTKAAPKFRDFSLYAWSACAVDYKGNIYGCGENLNSKHNSIGSPTTLTKYLPRGLPEDTEIFIVAEGYSSTSYVDVHGNAYVTGDSDARGNNHNDGSLAGPWVHFTGSGKPMFTKLASSPTSEAKRYSTSPRTTLNIETNIASDEIKYVILYPEDTEQYKDGETFYSKTFAEIEQPYYNKGTDPQLLLSPNYDLPSSRYYANPKISEDVFNAAYNVKAGSEKGMMDIVDSSGNKAFIKAELVQHNCVVWVQSKNSSGTSRAIYRFDNYYTQTKAWHEGVKIDDPSFCLYQPELVGGGYGLFLDRQGNLIPGEPPFGYDIVMPEPKTLTYWKLSPASQLDEEDEEDSEDGYKHRVDRTKEIFLTELSQKGDEAAKTPRVTFSYEKDPDMWVGADLRFVNEAGEEVRVMIGGFPVTQEPRDMFAPKGAVHVEGQDPYLPPEAEDPQTKVVGYSVGTLPDDTEGSYQKCDFPDGFKPLLNERMVIYIVYSTGMVSVTESFADISDGGDVAMKNSDGLFNVVRNLRRTIGVYENFGPTISGYVIVGHAIFIGDSVNPDETYYPWQGDEYVPQQVVMSGIEDNVTVKFLYKSDKNGNNIPDDEEGSVLVQWIAVNANNTAYRITEKTFCGNGAQNAAITVTHDKEQVLPEALYNPEQWIFRPGLAGDTLPYFPQGSGGSETIIFEVDVVKPVYFYYDEDYNENEIADKEEGFLTERYKLSSSMSDLIPPKADVASKWLGGQTYSGTAPLIQNYVAVGYLIEAEGVEDGFVERVERDQTGNVSVVYEIPRDDTEEHYTVTFLYKEDQNNNNIPDDEEGSVTIRWIGRTYAGNEVEIEKLVIVGYDGDDVTDMIYPPNPIDEVWRLVGSTVPDSVFLTHDPKSFAYEYTEVLEFATITVENTSTDGRLDFFYQYTKRLEDALFDVTAFAIPTYRVTGYEHYDNYGTLVDSGTSDTVRIDPSTGSQRIVFKYESTITTIVVRAVDAANDIVLKSQTVTDAIIGEKYAAAAPYVDDTWILTGEVLQVIDVAEGTNYITFEYEKATGNVTVLLKETDGNGQIIRVLSEDVEHGRMQPITIPGLTEAYYTKLSTEETVVDYTGASPVPQIVEYYYAKDMMDVAVSAVDEADGAVLSTVIHTAAARKGESYTAIAPTVDWYTIAESGSKSVYVDPAAADGTVIVTFAYKKDAIGEIAVRSFYNDADSGETELNAYTAKSLVGNKFTAVAGSYSGFQLISADTIGIIVSADGNENRIAFEYIDLRKNVGIFTQIESNELTRRPVSDQKHLDGSDITIIPPYMKNHLVVGYLIDEEEIMPVDPEIFESLPLPKEDVVDGMSIVFIYQPVQEIVNERFVDVTIQGVTDTHVHYSHVKRIAKAGLPQTLTVPDDVFEVPGYVLDSAADFVVTMPTNDEPVEKTFSYYPLATTVTIRMVDGTGTDVAESFAVGATADAPFTYNAPNVPDYYLAGNSLGKADPVLSDGTSEIVFVYEKITSKVTVIAKEDDTNGRIIGVFEVPDPAEGTEAYDVPDLSADYYTANDPTVEITYDGTNSVSVEAYYTKELETVGVEAVHYMTGVDLGTQTPLTGQRKGEAVAVGAPDLTNYVLVGPAVQIVIADGTNKAVFQYRPIGSDEIVVKAVDMDGNTLQSYRLTGAKDESFLAEPPVILGWKTSDPAQSAVIGTDSEIVFRYTKDVVTVTMRAVDDDGNELISTVTEVAKGGNYTAFAPHVPGYVVEGSSAYALHSLVADALVTFAYKRVETAVVTVTVTGRSAEGELYRHHIIRAKNSGMYDVHADPVAEYRLTGADTAAVDVQDENVTVIFEYESLYTTVTIYMVDEDTSEFLAIFIEKAEVDESYTFPAPNIIGYDLTSDSPVGTVPQVLPNGASEIAFTYQKQA